MPPSAPQPAADFHHYLEQPLCAALPKFTGLVARNRFEEDYERFAKYFNKNHGLVPKACRMRFEKTTKEERIPKRYDDYVRQEKEHCGREAGKTYLDDGYSNGGKGQKKYPNEALGNRGVVMLFVAQGLIVGGVMGCVWSQAMF
ncbi:hypothetical protein PMIN03_000048 [Paraphaeosphaeria minitans]|uniref:Uncharacterized protein n=1 Tax=Paraphaeosphaeria minitans TaxID=565426 RepID=A0A9P6GA72_9PLEO|nr:hypothetical protein PMIN01_09931 [Paraphaeosphaeria minitans]